jgi:hypothetical protein
LLLVGRKAGRGVHELKLGARVRDQVHFAPAGEKDYDLVISSCRPKDWNSSLTIRYDEQLYEFVRSFECEEPPRRFVTLLKKAPLSKIVRGIHDYNPDEVKTAN